MRSRPPVRLSWKDEEEIARRILSGEIGAVPTETVAGLVARSTATDRLNALKDSPAAKPLTLFASGFEQARELWGRPAGPAVEQLAALWPGPLTLVAGGPPPVGVRVPDYPPLLRLPARTGPLASTSANLSGAPAPARVEDLAQDLLARLDFIVSDPELRPSGLASTVLACGPEGVKLLRAGGIAEVAWRRVLA